MRKKLYLKVTNNVYNYGEYLLDICKIKAVSNEQTSRKTINIDSCFVHYLMKELSLSNFYRRCFIKFWTSDKTVSIALILIYTKCDLIDYNWNERVYYMVRERCELDHTLSWLSTLGGAFSALGDYFLNCADIAGKISLNQLKLALRLGDPTVASRCRLFLSLSLIQKKKFRIAQRIIYQEFIAAITSNIIDHRLINMCKGIWTKLQYEHSIYKNNSIN